MEIPAVHGDLFAEVGRLFIKVIEQADDYLFGRIVQVDLVGVGIEYPSSR